MDLSGHSEYEGGGVMPNTVFPKGSDALTPSDKLRLQSITGQEDDATVAPNPYHWHGNVRPDPITPGPTEAEIYRDERDRYRETPY
jgi:hypothetical protein